MKKVSALYTAGMIVVAGAVGCVAAEQASSQPFPALNGSCIGPLEVLQAAQAADGTYNGFTVNGQYVPIENGLTEPQLYATTKGCAPDGSFAVDPGDNNGVPGDGTTSTTDNPGQSTTSTTAGPGPTTSTTSGPTSTTVGQPTTTAAPTTTVPHHWLCLHKRVRHFVIAICHRI